MPPVFYQTLRTWPLLLHTALTPWLPELVATATVRVALPSPSRPRICQSLEPLFELTPFWFFSGGISAGTEQAPTCHLIAFRGASLSLFLDRGPLQGRVGGDLPQIPSARPGAWPRTQQAHAC